MLAQNLKRIREQIIKAELKYNRPYGSVKLLAVSKDRSVDEISIMAAEGQAAFGESYVKEAIKKIEALHDLNLEWHFIGKVQSNKAKLLAIYFSWVQSVSRLDIAELLSKHRSDELPLLNVCIEVNLSNEKSKGGVLLSEVFHLAQAVQRLPRLKLRGMMAIPSQNLNFEKQLTVFNELAREFNKLNAAGFMLDTLSMGMSDDFEAAIAAGSTMVRIGTAIFGQRRAKNLMENKNGG